MLRFMLWTWALAGVLTGIGMVTAVAQNPLLPVDGEVQDLQQQSPDDSLPVVVVRAGRPETVLWSFRQEPRGTQPRAARRGPGFAERDRPGRPRSQRSAARPDFDLAERVERLESEIKSLRRELEQLRHRISEPALGEAAQGAEQSP